MLVPTIKIVRPHPMPRGVGAAQVDLTPTDAVELVEWAQRVGKWQTMVAVGVEGPGVATIVETLCAIVDLHGRIALWHGAIETDRELAKLHGLPPLSEYTIADNALYCSELPDAYQRQHQHAVQRWHARRGADRFGGSGLRDISELALAACRVLHAEAFEEHPNERDVYLSEMLDFTTPLRPNTPTILAASTDTLAAASALLMCGQQAEAALLFKSVRTLQREAQQFAPLAPYKPYWEKP